MKIRNIAIVGGTHGNENTGVFLIQKLRSSIPSYKNLDLQYLLANPLAIKRSKRFIDSDLNRAFRVKDLQDIEKPEYEFNRAKIINNTLGPKGKSKTDFIIDLHTTTSNMGITAIFCQLNAINIQLAAYLKSKFENFFIYYMPPISEGEDQPYLDSIAPYSLAIEVGPVPNGILRYDVIEMTEKTIKATLEFITLHNNGTLPKMLGSIEIFKYYKTVLFPTDIDGNITAYIHKNLQDKDFFELKNGDPIFHTIKDQTLYNEEVEPTYPVFINEAAYYRKKIAFSLAKKISMPVQQTQK